MAALCSGWRIIMPRGGGSLFISLQVRELGAHYYSNGEIRREKEGNP